MNARRYLALLAGMSFFVLSYASYADTIEEWRDHYSGQIEHSKKLQGAILKKFNIKNFAECFVMASNMGGAERKGEITIDDDRAARLNGVLYAATLYYFDYRVRYGVKESTVHDSVGEKAQLEDAVKKQAQSQPKLTKAQIKKLNWGCMDVGVDLLKVAGEKLD